MAKHESRVEEVVEDGGEEVGRGGALGVWGKLGITIKFSNYSRCCRRTAIMEAFEGKGNLVNSQRAIKGGTGGLGLGGVCRMKGNRSGGGQQIAKAMKVLIPCLSVQKGHREVSVGAAQRAPKATRVGVQSLEEALEALKLVCPAFAANKAVMSTLQSPKLELRSTTALGGAEVAFASQTLSIIERGRGAEGRAPLPGGHPGSGTGIQNSSIKGSKGSTQGGMGVHRSKQGGQKRGGGQSSSIGVPECMPPPAGGHRSTRKNRWATEDTRQGKSNR